jgi:hypothetical protein
LLCPSSSVKDDRLGRGTLAVVADQRVDFPK